MVHALRGGTRTRIAVGLVSMVLLGDLASCLPQAADGADSAAPRVDISASPSPQPSIIPTPAPSIEEEPAEEDAPAAAPAAPPASSTPSTPPYASLTAAQVESQLLALYPQLTVRGFDSYGCVAYGPVYTLTPDGSQKPPTPALQDPAHTYNSYKVLPVDVNVGGRVQLYSCQPTY